MIILLFSLWLIFAVVFVFGKMALGYFYFLDFIFIRMLFAGTVFLVIHKLQNKDAELNLCQTGSKGFFGKFSTNILLFFAGLFNMFLPFVLEYFATQTMNPAKISLLYALTPFVTIVISLFLGQEQFSFRKAFGFFLGWTAAIVNIVPDGVFSKNTFTNFFGNAEMILLLAIILGSFAWFIVGELLKRNQSIAKINGVSMLVAATLTLILKKVLYNKWINPFELINIPIKGWIVLITTTILSNFIGYSLYSYLLKFFSPTALSLSGFSCPILSGIIAAVLLGAHNFSVLFFVSLFLGLAGLIFYQDR